MANAIYSNARARVLETSLLGKDRIDRMLDCVTADDAVKVLEEINFGEGVTIESALDFELLINAEKKKLFDFIKEAGPSKDFGDFILLKNDFHNAEAYIKAKYLKIDAEPMTEISGSIDKAELKEKIMVDDYDSFPNGLKKALSYCDEEFVGGRANGLKVNSAFEKYYFEELYERSKTNKYLSEIYRSKADAANISIALRLRNYNEAKGLFVKNGDLTDAQLKSLCEDQLETLKDKFKFYIRYQMLAVALEGAIAKKPLSEFERIAEGFAIDRLLKEKFSNEGILPFMQYCFYKLGDISNVRIIMVGLINGLDKTEIRRRLRSYYER